MLVGKLVACGVFRELGDAVEVAQSQLHALAIDDAAVAVVEQLVDVLREEGDLVAL